MTAMDGIAARGPLSIVLRGGGGGGGGGGESVMRTQARFESAARRQ